MCIRDSILGASWERLGASWGRPGGIPEPEGDPRWTPGWAQNRPKIDPKSHWFFDRFLDAILTPKWSQNGSPNHPKTIQTSVSFFDRFLHRFLDRSWGPKSLKMSTSCTREAHFHKNRLFRFWHIFGSKNDEKRFPKCSQNGLTNQSKNQKFFWWILDLFWVAFGSILGSKYHQKSSRKFSVFLEIKKWVLEPPVEIQGRPRGIWRPAGMPEGCPREARANGPKEPPGPP